MVSIATSLPSAFRSVPVILVGQALASVQTMVGEPVSSSRLIVTGTRLIVFILIWLNQSQNLLSPLNVPFFMVTLPTFFRPGILITENSGLSPWRYLISSDWISRPETSWNDMTCESHFTWK